jgi:hypothetical protein
MSADESGSGRPARGGSRKTVPVWVVACLGFTLGFLIGGWLGGVIGLGFVLVASRLL